MKKIMLLTMLMLTACGSSLLADNSYEPNTQAKTATFAAVKKAGYEVKIIKNGSVLKTFKNAEKDAMLALFVRDRLSIRLISPDQKQTVAIHITGGKVGFYTLPEKGKAEVQFQSEEPLINWTAIEKGELNLTESTATHCSGSFYGILASDDGNSYSIEGKFNNIRVKKF